MAKYKGSPCKGDCSGHRAGARYARNGGSQYSPYSSSFNNGMNIEMGKVNFLTPQPTFISKKNLAIGAGITAAVAAINKKPTP